MDRSGAIVPGDKTGEVMEPRDLALVIRPKNGSQTNVSEDVNEIIQSSSLDIVIQSTDVGQDGQPTRVDKATQTDEVNQTASVDKGTQTEEIDRETEPDNGLSYYGVLVEYTHPHDTIDTTTFRDWANNKHGPERVKLEYIKSGHTYQAMDSDEPQYMTIYEVEPLGKLLEESFTSLGKCHTATGQDLSDRYVDIHSTIYNYACARGLDNPSFGKKLRVSRWMTKTEDLKEIIDMYEVHLDGLSKIPGWIRSRVLVTNDTFAKNGSLFFLSIHEYETESMYGECPEYHETINSAERARIEELKLFQERRVYDLVHRISACPRDLNYRPHCGRYIESDFECEDGVKLHYRIEGSHLIDAPLLVFVNTGLTNYTIWDQVIELYVAGQSTYRFLRYEMREAEQFSTSRFADMGAVRVHTEDLMILLKCLFVEKIHAVVGAGLGGAIAVSLAIKSPKIINGFIACGIHPSSYEGVTEWKVQPSEDNKVDFDATCKGQQLVDRWFRTDHTHLPVTNNIKERIENGDGDVALNVVHGVLEALTLEDNTETDSKVKTPLVSALIEHGVKGLLVAGEDDVHMLKIISKVMKGMQRSASSTVQCFGIRKSGHLPMVENPQDFVEAMDRFLNAE